MQDNQLQFEKSPYLLQHKSNPVRWLPWGSAAFDRARREEKPISDVYPVIDNDLARDNVENDLPAADREDLR